MHTVSGCFPATSTPTYTSSSQADSILGRMRSTCVQSDASEIETVIKDGVEHRAIDLLEETPTDIVQRQVNAYNAKNIEAFMITYSSDAKVFQYPDLPWQPEERKLEKDTSTSSLERDLCMREFFSASPQGERSSIKKD